MNRIPFSDLTLEDLLPHRGRMMLVRKVFEVDRTHARTLCRPEKSWPMSDDRGVHPLILIELAAQSAGVCNGLDRIETRGIDSGQMGWLVGIKKADFFIDNLPLGSDIITCAENSYSFGNLREVFCEQTLNGTLISRITLQLFQA